MKNTKRVFSIAATLILISIAGCDKLTGLFFQKASDEYVETKIEGTPLAKINSAVITLEDFKSRVENFNQISETKIDSFDRKKSFLQTLIQQELLYQNAISKGLSSDPQIDRAVNEFRKGLMVQKLISQELSGIYVEPKEIEDFYTLTKTSYQIPQEVKVSEIVASSEETARQILIELLKGANFASIAQQFSKSESAKNGGKLGWIKPGERKIERFDEIAFSLKKNEISSVFQTPDGYFIIKVEDRRGGEIKPISQVREEVKEQLLNYKQNQKIVELERSLRTASNIQIYEELLR